MWNVIKKFGGKETVVCTGNLYKCEGFKQGAEYMATQDMRVVFLIRKQ